MAANYNECYIAFLDILGFKNMINTLTCEEILHVFTYDLKNKLSGIYNGKEPLIDTDNIHMRVMSDSICFWIGADIENALAGLIVTCLHFQAELLYCKNPILLRGAITKGGVFANDQVIFGPGYVDAYLMEENNAKYPRIIMANALREEALIATKENCKYYLYTHVFEDFDAFLSLDYLELFEGYDNEDNCKRLFNHITNVLDNALDSSIREKFLYVKRRLLRWYNPDTNSTR